MLCPQDGHATKEAPRDEFAAWLLSTFTATWSLFEAKLLARWDARAASGQPMAAYPALLFGPEVEGGKEATAAAQKAFVAGVRTGRRLAGRVRAPWDEEAEHG